ncbi:MAG: InlB B-repeat-containing protein, partial [Oscillospiraceae bacterium]|nr:InlB B-repeat-containing protein [Oscillospiraceae bacterium]
MKQIKRLAALLLTAVMILSLFPAVSFAAENSLEQPLISESNYGLINQYHVGTTAVTDAYLRGETLELNGVSVGQPVRDLPSSWDSRNYNWITSVKNQGNYGSCWAHAAMGSVEAYMIKNGIPVGTGAAATTSLNLSETQHCFFNYSSAYDAEGMLTGDKTTLSGSDSCLDAGGNGEMSAYTLQRWTGVSSESVSALAYGNASTVARSGLGSQYAYGSNVAHVQNSVWIPATNLDGVKQAIMDYGAGNISYYAGSSNYTYNCTIDTSSQDSSSHKWANHAITLVGWDDTIAASNFSPNKPSKPGAWLCRNSWGTSYFNQGYMWISYEDTSVLEGYIYFYDAEPIDNYQHNYQYDGTCNPVCYGKGWPSGEDYYVGFENNTKVANVFTAKGSESLKAIAFCNWDEAMTYTVEVYKNPSTGNPSSGTLMSTQNGYLAFSGYYTIPLDTPVSLAAGDTFSVVVTQNVPVADDSGKYVHTPYDASFNNTDVVSWANWTHTNHGNTSYYQEPNGAWTDCPDNGDYRIKAYTDDVLFNLTAVSNNTAWGTVSVSGSTIIAAPAEGYYVESCDVISGEASWTINGNTISVSASADCTIRVNFAVKPSYTVSFVASGVDDGSQTALVNDVITLPASVSVNPQGWTFAGWMTQQIEETDVKPEFFAPGASYTVTGNTTLYAVYTRTEEGTGDPYYELVSSAPADWSGNYVITYGVDTSLYALTGVSGSTGGTDIESTANATVFSSTGMSLADNKLSNVANSYLFTLAPSGNYYSVKSVSTGSYLGETTSYYLGAYSNLNTSYCLWTPGYYSSNASTLYNANSSTSYPLLSFHTTNNYFWSGSTNNQGTNAQNVRLWKEALGTTTYYWTDPEEIIPEEHTVSFTTPDGVTAPAPMVMDNVTGGTLPTAEAPEGYTFLGWVVEDYDNVTEQPAEILTGVYKPQADITLKALYTYMQDGGSVETGYYLVTDAAALAAGDKIVITANGSGTASLSTTQNNNNRSAVAGVKSADYQSFEPADTTAILTLGEGTVSGSFSLYDPANNGYLYAASSSSNYLRTKATLDANGSWAISVTNNEAALVAQGSYTRKNLRYNSTSNLFSCYATGQQSVYLYRYEEHETGTACYTTIIRAPEHVHSVAYFEGQAATCTEAGVKAYYYCEDQSCELYGKMFEDEALTVEITDAVIPALGHDLSATVVAPSCTEQGYTEYRCSRCDYQDMADFTDPLGHDFSVVVEEVAPTCTEAGLKEIKCSRCDETEITELPALGHSPAEAVIENEVAPSCTEAGSYESVVYCSVCHEVLSRETVAVAALGHNPGEAVQENYVEPTATTDGGYDSVVYCTRCSTELSREHTTIPATGPAEPVLDESIVLYNSIGIGIEIQTTFGVRKTVTDRFES